ncbi:MAG: hypothetical protein JST90_07245 [Bacteroidetes bacterium]|nr:hypothetical protein [Bacteroidota bacterium]
MIGNHTNTLAGFPYSNYLPQQLFWTENSGRIVFRKKIDTVIGIDHPGIVLGKDIYGYEWIAHHHYKNVYPSIDRMDAFSLGREVYYSNKPVYYDRAKIVERTIYHWLEKKEYSWLRQNCQHFVNNIANGTHTSEAIEDIGNMAFTASGITGLIGLFTGNKTLKKIAVVSATVGIGAKALSRTPVNNALPSRSKQRLLR